MRILRIITRLNIGGPAIQAITLQKELAKKGHVCRLLAGVGLQGEGERWMIEGIPQAVDVRFIPFLQREVDWRKDWRAFLRLRKEIKEFAPDVIHTHMSKAGALGRLAARMTKGNFKLVHTFHGHVFYGYFGRRKTYVFKSIERQLAKRTDAIVAISELQRRDLINNHIEEGRIRLIPLGFRLEPFLKLPQFEYNARNLSVGIVGRLAEVKHHELFFTFVEELRKSFKVNAFVIGDGERGKELEDLAKGTPCNFLGWVPPKCMPAVYSFLDVVVCTSRNEGTPVALIEAMAAGRLVVSTPVGGVRDLIGKDGERGLYLLENSIRNTCIMLEEVLKSGYYEVIIDRARRYVAESHTLDRLVDRVENLYFELLKR